MTAINPRYAAYAWAYGRSPDEQLAFDRERWPGGSMVGFVIWNNERLHEFGKLHPEAFCVSGTGTALVDHAAYDKWLVEYAALQIEKDLEP